MALSRPGTDDLVQPKMEAQGVNWTRPVSWYLDRTLLFHLGMGWSIL